MISKPSKYLISAIVSLLLVFVINSIEPSKTNGFGEYAGMTIGFLIIGFLTFWLIGKFEGSEKGRKLQRVIEDKRELEMLNKKVHDDLLKYNEYQTSFKYFSNEKLSEIYENSTNKDMTQFELLALEEELVSRGLIDHSPMHEKLYLMKKKFNL